MQVAAAEKEVRTELNYARGDTYRVPLDHFIHYFLNDKIPFQARQYIKEHQAAGMFEGEPIEVDCFSNNDGCPPTYYNLVWRVQYHYNMRHEEQGTMLFLTMGDTHHMINTSGEFHAMTEQWWTVAGDDY